MAQQDNTISTVVSIIVVVLVAAFALQYFFKSANAAGSAAAIGAAGGSGSGAGSAFSFNPSGIGKLFSNLFSTKPLTLAQVNADLVPVENANEAALLSQYDNSAPFIPQDTTDTNPFDETGISFPINSIGGPGGGTGASDTNTLDTNYDDSGWSIQ